MPETRYSAQAELRNPLQFLSSAMADLRVALTIAWRLQAGNLLATHRRSWLGRLWLLAPTLATTLVCIHLRSLKIVSIAPTEVPYPVFILAGTIFWQVFIDSLNAPLHQLSTSKQLLTRSRVPHEAVILAGMLGVLMNFLIRSAILAAVMFAFNIPFGSSILLVPFGVIALALLGLALGVLAAPFGLLYDDVGRAISALTAFWFFLTPVAYPVTASKWVSWNPVSPLLQTTRAWLFSQETSPGFLPLTIAALVILIFAWLFYRLARPHLVARLG